MPKFNVDISVAVYFDKLVEIEAETEEEAHEKAQQYYLDAHVEADWTSSDYGDPDIYVEKVED